MGDLGAGLPQPRVYVGRRPRRPRREIQPAPSLAPPGGGAIGRPYEQPEVEPQFSHL